MSDSIINKINHYSGQVVLESVIKIAKLMFFNTRSGFIFASGLPLIFILFVLVTQALIIQTVIMSANVL